MKRLVPTPRTGRDLRRLAPLALTCLCLLAVAACSEPTGPGRDDDEGSLVVSLEDFDTRIEVEDGWPIQKCEIRLGLTAGADSARILYVRLRFHIGEDRESAVDSTTIHGLQLADAFGTSVLEAGEHAEAWLLANAPAPFEISATFVYREGGRERELQATGRINCGAVVAPGTAAPTLKLLEISASDPDPGPGDTIRVRYRTQSGAGLWTSGVQVGGAFSETRTRVDAHNTTIERTENFEIPYTVNPAVPVTVSVFAFDAALRLAEADSVSTIAMVDTVAPSASVQFPGGQFAIGDFVEFSVTASDNFAPTWVIWELGTPLLRKDSIPIGVPATSTQVSVRFQVQEAWADQVAGITVRVRDHLGVLSPPVSSAPNALRFYQVTEEALGEPVVTLGPPGGPAAPAIHVVFDPVRNRLYASHYALDLVSAYDVPGRSRIGTAATPTFPAGMALTHSGDSLLVSASFASVLGVIGLDDFTARPAVPVAAIDSLGSVNLLHPSGVAITAAGTALMQVNNAYWSATRTVTVDLATGQSRVRIDNPYEGGTQTDNRWRRLATTPDGARIVVADDQCVRYYRAQTDDFSSCVAVAPGGFHQGSISADGNRIAVGRQVLDAAFGEVRAFESSNLVVSADGETVTFVRGNRLIRARVSDGHYLSARRLPFFPDALIVADALGLVIPVRRLAAEVMFLPLDPP